MILFYCDFPCPLSAGKLGAQPTQGAGCWVMVSHSLFTLFTLHAVLRSSPFICAVSQPTGS